MGNLKKRNLVCIVAMCLLSTSMSVTNIVKCRSKHAFEPNLFSQNVEALTRGEVIIELTCNPFAPVVKCEALCLSCMATYTTPGNEGQHIKGSDKCTCGAIL